MFSKVHFPSSRSTSAQPLLTVRWLVSPMAAILGIQRSLAGAPQLQEWQLPMPNTLSSSGLAVGVSWADADKVSSDRTRTPRGIRIQSSLSFLLNSGAP